MKVRCNCKKAKRDPHGYIVLYQSGHINGRLMIEAYDDRDVAEAAARATGGFGGPFPIAFDFRK